jgi:hypothetical protein
VKGFMNVSPEVIAFFGLFMGTFARIMIPYLRKLWDGSIEEFDIYYLWVAFIGIVFSAIISMLLVPEIMLSDELSFLQLFAGNFTIGFGATDIAHEVLALKPKG